MQNCCLLLLLLHFSPLAYTPFPPSGNTPAQSCFEVFVSDLDLVCKSHLSLALSRCPPWLGWLRAALESDWESEAVHQQRIQMRGNCAGLALKSLGKGYLQNFKCEKNCKYMTVCAVLLLLVCWR